MESSRRRFSRLCRLLVAAGVVTVAAPVPGVDAEEAQLGGFSATASAAGQSANLTVTNFSVDAALTAGAADGAICGVACAGGGAK